MASGIQNATDLIAVLDAIYDNVSNMDTYTGADGTTQGSLRLYYNEITKTATIFKKVTQPLDPLDPTVTQIVATFNPENIVTTDKTFITKVMKNVVVSSNVAYANDVGLGAYVNVKTLIRNICVALGVNMAANFDELNPGYYEDMVNIVRKYYGDSLENNAPYGMAKKITTVEGQDVTTYHNYIPVMIIVEMAIYLNNLGLFNVGGSNLYQPMPLPRVNNSTYYNFYDYIDGFGTYYDFMNKDEYKKFVNSWIDIIKIYSDSEKETMHNLFTKMMELYEPEIDFDGIIYCVINNPMILSVVDKKSVKMVGNSSTIFPRNSATGTYSGVMRYCPENTIITSYTVQYNYSTQTYTNNKTITEKAAGTIDTTLSIGGVFNIKCNKYLKPYYTRNNTYPNNFRTNSKNTNGSSADYVFIDNYAGITSINDFYTLKLTDSNYAFRVHMYRDVYRFFKDNNITFTENDFAFGFKNGSNWKIYIARNTNIIKFFRENTSIRYRGDTTGTLNGICCRDNIEGSPYNSIVVPYIDESYATSNYRYTFDSNKSIDYYYITLNNDETISINDSGTITASYVEADFESGSTYPYSFNVGEIITIEPEYDFEGLTLQDGATYPSNVIDINSFNTTYPDWQKIGYSQPFFENDVITNTYNAQWAAITVNQDPPTTQEDGQKGEIDTDHIDDVIEDIDNAEEENDDPPTDPNADELEDEGETPEDGLDRVKPNALDGGFIKQYALDLTEMATFSDAMKEPDIIQTLQRLVNNPIEAIISLQVGYTYNSTAAVSEILQINGLTWASLVNQPTGLRLKNNIVEGIDIGSVEIPEKYETYQDYTTTNLQLYLPFVGFVHLDINDFIGKRLDLEANIDTLTGAILYKVCSYIGTKRRELYQFQGNCQQQVPISQRDNTQLLTGMMQLGATAITGGVMMGVGGAALNTANALATNIENPSLNMLKPNITHGGTVGGNVGLLGNLIPYIIISRKQIYDPKHEDLATLQGLPSNSAVSLGSISGYTVVKDVLVKINATDEECNEIERLLKGGVIL